MISYLLSSLLVFHNTFPTTFTRISLGALVHTNDLSPLTPSHGEWPWFLYVCHAANTKRLYFEFCDFRIRLSHNYLQSPRFLSLLVVPLPPIVPTPLAMLLQRRLTHA